MEILGQIFRRYNDRCRQMMAPESGAKYKMHIHNIQMMI